MVDTHCHLDACEPPDRELVDRARQAGVTRLATVGTDAASIGRALAATRAHPEVAAIVGRHPHEATGFDGPALEEIEQAAGEPRRLQTRPNVTTDCTHDLWRPRPNDFLLVVKGRF